MVPLLPLVAAALGLGCVVNLSKLVLLLSDLKKAVSRCSQVDMYRNWDVKRLQVQK